MQGICSVRQSGCIDYDVSATTCWHVLWRCRRSYRYITAVLQVVCIGLRIGHCEAERSLSIRLADRYATQSSHLRLWIDQEHTLLNITTAVKVGYSSYLQRIFACRPCSGVQRNAGGRLVRFLLNRRSHAFLQHFIIILRRTCHCQGYRTWRILLANAINLCQ